MYPFCVFQWFNDLPDSVRSDIGTTSFKKSLKAHINGKCQHRIDTWLRSDTCDRCQFNTNFNDTAHIPDLTNHEIESVHREVKVINDKILLKHNNITFANKTKFVSRCFVHI